MKSRSMRLSPTLFALGFVIMTTAVLMPGVARAQAPFEVLHNFADCNLEGCFPSAPLVRGTDGNLYGTTQTGGTGGRGTIFKITSAGAVTTLYSFTGAPDGDRPIGGLTQATDGSFYGMTDEGGADEQGTIFKMTPAGVVTVLHSFAGGASDGARPQDSRLIQAADGNFYGTTIFGGPSDQGTVFQMTPAGDVTILHFFTGGPADGAYPRGTLIQASDGNLYGIGAGGAFDRGTVFQITLAGVATILHSFAGADGSYPQGNGLVEGTDGNLYGTIFQGGAWDGGTIFKVSPTGVFTSLHSFHAPSEGAAPMGSLVQGPAGSFYGTTVGGGGGAGTVFQVSASGDVTILHSFVYTDGAGPRAGLMQTSAGHLYGTTYQGGTSNWLGVVFHINVAPAPADFNGDGKSDVLWRNSSTGQNIGWLMNGTTLGGAASLPTIADTNWEVNGIGDLNGDGKADVIWRNKVTGQNIGWLMNGLTVATAAFLPTIADTNWQIVAVGDLNGDGNADVMLRNKVTGQNIAWLMNGLAVINSALLPTIVDTNWEVRGIGDVNADGKVDVIWRNKVSGQHIGWLMNGVTVATAAFLPTIADTNWMIGGVGDLNGDGKADVLLRNVATGQDIGWLMDGLTVADAAFLPTIVDTNWEIKAVGDINGDGNADVLFHNKVTGQNMAWLMNGLTMASAAFLPAIADTNWQIVGR